MSSLDIVDNGHDPVGPRSVFKSGGNKIADGVCPETVSSYHTSSTLRPYLRRLCTKCTTAERTPNSARARKKYLCAFSFLHGLEIVKYKQQSITTKSSV
jgi:hypothetical protein